MAPQKKKPPIQVRKDRTVFKSVAQSSGSAMIMDGVIERDPYLDRITRQAWPEKNREIVMPTSAPKLGDRARTPRKSNRLAAGAARLEARTQKKGTMRGSTRRSYFKFAHAHTGNTAGHPTTTRLTRGGWNKHIFTIHEFICTELNTHTVQSTTEPRLHNHDGSDGRIPI